MLVKIKDICNITMGQSPESKYYSNTDGFPFLQGNRTFGLKYPFIDTYTTKITKKAKVGSILISVRAPVGDLNIANQEICIGRGIASLEAIDGDNEFLYYALKSNMNNILNKGNGTTYDSITVDALKEIEINIPNNKQSREKISKILSGIDNQIKRNNAMTKRLQVMGNTIYSKTFSACKDKISFYDYPYLELLKPGITQFNGEKIYIPTAEVNGNNINFNSSKITFENRENRANMQPIYNSVWFAKMKNSNKHIYLTEKDNYLIDNFIFSTGFCGAKCKDFAFEYIAGTVELLYFEEMKDKLAHGATMESINNDDLKSLLIPNPSKELLEQYHNITKDIYKQMSLIRIENHKLETLKNTLLPLLINGQLEV